MTEPVIERMPSATGKGTFTFVGPRKPTMEMRIVAETASRMDRQWFAARPSEPYRVRWSLPGEFPPNCVECPETHPLDPRGRFVTAVMRLSDGRRGRLAVHFVEDTEILQHEIPREYWPVIYQEALKLCDLPAMAKELWRRR